MFRRFEVENIMCLKQMRVDLDEFTVFVGRNASGKSAIFKALVTLARLAGPNPAPIRGRAGSFTLEQAVTLDEFVRDGDQSLPIIFRAWLDDLSDEPTYELELRKVDLGWSVFREILRAHHAEIQFDDRHPFEHPTERLGNKILLPPLHGTLRYVVNPFAGDSAARPFIDPIIEVSNRIGEAWRYRPSAIDIASFALPATPGSRPPLSTRRVRSYVRENGHGLPAVLQAGHRPTQV